MESDAKLNEVDLRDSADQGHRVRDEDSEPSFNHVVAFIDILGSSQILSVDEEEMVREYLRGVKGLYKMVQGEGAVGSPKMFSDNVLIYTRGDTQEEVEAMISFVASIQWSVMRDFHMLIRGGVVIDKISHVPADPNDFIIGKAIVRAYEMESSKAIYPRIIVSDEVLERCASRDGNQPIKDDWDRPFIDYLQAALGDITQCPVGLDRYRRSLMKHISDNSRMGDCDSDVWDRIRNKDLWVLTYYNNFCKEAELGEMTIRYIEEYNPSLGKITIEIDDEGEVMSDGGRRDEDDGIGLRRADGCRPGRPPPRGRGRSVAEVAVPDPLPPPARRVRPKAVAQRFCDGYSDGIDEAVRDMASAGILRKAGRGYALTDYGEGLKGLAMNECADARMVPGIGRLAVAVAGIRDRSLAALEYHFYPGPVPMRFFDRLNSKAVYDGIPLHDYPKDEFERKLRSGEPISEGARWSADTTYAMSGWRRAVRTPSSATSG